MVSEIFPTNCPKCGLKRGMSGPDEERCAGTDGVPCLRRQGNKRLPSIDEMAGSMGDVAPSISQQFRELEVKLAASERRAEILEKALRQTVGLLSTRPGFSHLHPYAVYNDALRLAESDGGGGGGSWSKRNRPPRSPAKELRQNDQKRGAS